MFIFLKFLLENSYFSKLQTVLSMSLDAVLFTSSWTLKLSAGLKLHKCKWDRHL